MKKTFVENQNLTEQKSIQRIFGLTFVSYAIGIVFGYYNNKSFYEAFIVLLFVSFGLYILLSKIKMTTKIDSKSLKINHPFLGRLNITISDIASIEQINFRFSNYRRSHHNKFGSLYRVYGKEGISIKTKNNFSFFLGSQKSVELYAFLNHELNIN